MASPSWQAYQNNAKQDVLFTQIAYEDKSENQAEFQELAKEIAPNHELFLYSDYMDDTKGFQYRCAIFIDRKNKQIVCANAGTRLGINKKGASDLIDDAKLILHLPPRKLKSAHILNETILDNLGDEISQYNFHFTGHSLGAAMAQIQATDLFLQLRDKGIKPKEISTITFENPGAKPIINKMLKKQNLDPNAVDIDHVVVNNRANFINTLNAQSGKVFQIVPQTKPTFRDKITSTVKAKFEETLPNGGAIFDFLQENMAPILSKVISQFIPEPIKVIYKISSWLLKGNLLQQIKDHSLDNFSDVIVKEQGNVRLKAGEVILLKDLIQASPQIMRSDANYDQKLFTELQNLKNSNQVIGKQEFSIANPSDLREKITYSSLELDTAKRKISQKNPGFDKNLSSGFRI
jgi:hypothetical protein